jgi:hypothetical protein
MYDMNVVKKAYNTARGMNVSSKIMLALFEAAIVESGFRNLNYGDRDSVGFLQQRPSQGWGTVAQCRDVAYATKSFVNAAKPIENKYKTAGQLAQGVQRSAFPDKYDKVENEAKSLLNKVSNGNYNAQSSTTSIFDFNSMLSNIIIPFITKLGIYLILVIIIFIVLGFVYAEKETKSAIKIGKKVVTKGVL